MPDRIVCAVSEPGAFADAAVMGSAIVQTVEENPGREAEAVLEFLSSITKCRSGPEVQVRL